MKIMPDKKQDLLRGNMVFCFLRKLQGDLVTQNEGKE